MYYRNCQCAQDQHHKTWLILIQTLTSVCTLCIELHTTQCIGQVSYCDTDAPIATLKVKYSGLKCATYVHKFNMENI